MSDDDSPDFRAFKERYSYGANDHALHTHTPLGFYQDGWRDGRHEVFDALPHAAARTIQAEAALAAAEAQVARLRPLLERCLSAVVDWQREQRESHPWHVDGWLLEEQIRAALDPGEPPAEPSTEE